MIEKKSFLRVLYTINSSPQYILARSHGTVAISLIQPQDEQQDTCSSPSQPLYATVSLKSCLDTICRSSPELTQDRTRDFSLYVLDPLESNSAPAPVHIANGTAESSSTRNGAAAQDQPRGVAVGLGLMSWAMSEREPVMVVGTLVKQNTGVEALEVIFALRETMVMQKPISNDQYNSVALVKEEYTASSIPSASTASQLLVNSMTSLSSFADYSASNPQTTQHRSKVKAKPPKSGRPSTTPVTESDKLMNADTYIGPLKKKGRPRTAHTGGKTSATPSNITSSSARKVVIVIDGSDSENGAPTSKPKATPTHSGPATQSLTPANTSQPSSQASEANAHPAQVKSEPQEPNIMALIAHLTESPEQQAAILQVLSSLAGSNPETVAACVKQLIAQSMKPAISTAPPEVDHAGTESHPTSTSVVVDKENVNPVQRKSMDKDQDCKVLGPGPSTNQTSPERVVRSLGLSSRSNENLSSSSISSKPISSSQRPLRKRTLSDFMDEKEGRSKGKGKERERGSDKRESSKAQQQSRSQSSKVLGDSLRHYPRLANFNQPRLEQPSNYYRTPLECLTSPVRQVNDVAASDAGPSRVSFQAPAPPQPSTLLKPSASSPVRGTDAANRRRYKVPDWAKTNTATQPRLSEEAQRALQTVEEQKHQQRLATRRTNAQSKAKKGLPPSFPFETSSNTVFSNVECPPPPSSEPAVPLVACSDGPVFPGTSIAFPILASNRSSSPPPSFGIIPKTPKTPTRPRHMPRATPGQEDDSLFTPIGRSGSLFGSVHAPSPHLSMPSILTSPLGNRKKVRVSLGTPMLSGKGAAAVSAWSSSVASSTSETSLKTETNNTSKDDLAKELETALLEDDDCPPSSLPIASSDMDIADAPEPETLGDEDIELGLHSAQPSPVKQHWPGLPPSSPPPPSSPMLLPEVAQPDMTTDEDMDELPIATSDSEMDGFDTDATASPVDQLSPEQGQGVDQPSPAESQDAFSLEQEGIPDMESFGDMPFWSDSFNNPTSSELFEQYTNVNAQSDDQQFPVADADQQTFMQGVADVFPEAFNGLATMDFTEFWASVLSPLIQQNTAQDQPAGCDQTAIVASDTPSFGDIDQIDHLKVAEDMQSLLGGCLM
ncbi:hypothetical protein BJ165DRAFT_1454848 [Panaeolus papilionaceus]|nr:hypothetical protein BJ165DRAFT_1454848 [Panaeolus papilionaceus]